MDLSRCTMHGSTEGMVTRGFHTDKRREERASGSGRLSVTGSHACHPLLNLTFKGFFPASRVCYFPRGGEGGYFVSSSQISPALRDLPENCQFLEQGGCNICSAKCIQLSVWWDWEYARMAGSMKCTYGRICRSGNSEHFVWQVQCNFHCKQKTRWRAAL